MKKVKKIIPVLRLIIPMQVFADEAQARMDQRMLEAILIFLRYVSAPVFVIAIGMLISSMRNQNATLKVDSLKVLGVSFLLLLLHPFAKASGLC
jgi:hypothetical protein